MATVEIGVEVKIVAKAMIKQINRVTRDLRDQVREFKKSGGKPFCIALAGVNWAERYRSFEGDKHYDTKGTAKDPHPVTSANEAGLRLVREAAPDFDEFLLLLYRATNLAPFPFEWVGEERTDREYAALLTRVARKYDELFS